MLRSMSIGAHERGCGRHALEGEGGEERRRPAPDAGIVLAQHLVGIEVLRARQRFSFGDASRGKRSHGMTAVIASNASCLLSRAAIRAAPTRA